MTQLLNIIDLDKNLLLTLNGMNSPFWDNFFFLFTQTITWVPLYLTIIYIIVKSQKKGSIITLISLIVLISLCDQISTNIFKEGFERLRPSQDPTIQNMVHIVGGRKGGLYGFVSSHAANSFALAMFVSMLFRNRALSITIFGWALLNSYSRIYLGLHYPGDILGGMVLGIVLTIIVYVLYLRVYPRFVFLPHNTKLALKKDMARVFKPYYPKIIIFTIIICILMLLISAKFFLKLS